MELPYLADDAALTSFIAAWNAGALPKPAWTHAAHVAVCAWHAWPDTPVDELVATMRAGIRAYNHAVGTADTATSGYHETLTQFWARQVAGHLRGAPSDTRLQAVRDAVGAYGAARSLHAAHYSFDVVGDLRARAEWVPPDRSPADAAGPKEAPAAATSPRRDNT